MNIKLLKYVEKAIRTAVANHAARARAVSDAHTLFRNSRDDVGAFGRPRTERSVRRTFGYGRP